MRTFLLTPIVTCRLACFLALAGMQVACVSTKQTEAKAADAAKTAQPGLFTLPPEQLSHVSVVPVRRMSWPVAVHTTGTVDWDADHTTQAITQVNGPIARILVDTGTPVKAGDPLLYVSSPDVANATAVYRKARNRKPWPSGFRIA